MIESCNVVGTGITSDDNSFLFDLMSLKLNHRLSRVWQLTIPSGRGMMNAI